MYKELKIKKSWEGNLTGECIECTNSDETSEAFQGGCHVSLVLYDSKSRLISIKVTFMFIKVVL